MIELQKLTSIKQTSKILFEFSISSGVEYGETCACKLIF
nr:MAG TPA: hypothetical protein [Caudoviricetes sp.]